MADAGGGGREKSRLSKTESSEAGAAEKGRRWRWRRRRRWWEGEAMALQHSRISEVAGVVLYYRERRWSCGR